MKLKPGDLVHVTTHDIEHGNDGWQSIKDVVAAAPRVYNVVGWVVKVRKRTLTLAPMTVAGSAHCYYLLPRGGIVKLRRLETP